jgi:hypothetical protein
MGVVVWRAEVVAANVNDDKIALQADSLVQQTDDPLVRAGAIDGGTAPAEEMQADALQVEGFCRVEAQRLEMGLEPRHERVAYNGDTHAASQELRWRQRKQMLEQPKTT